MKHKVQVVIIEKNSGSLLQFKMVKERGNFWQNITGSVEEGESYEEGARRELYEETGLSLGPLAELNLTFHFVDRFRERVEEKVFLARYEAPRLIKLSEEHDAYRFIPLDRVRPYHFGHLSNYEAFLKAKLRAQYS